eukprot:TRINITY_DN1385_c0_g1_i1.p1 TRINITY_DN1385_c0_g1~~TRINITY_DN1385_c0_g1_i1.p1  ORF type:complete len:274 (+),score=39.52 TRINITY_DN1385_c0_g1_i1:25-846(+)
MEGWGSAEGWLPFEIWLEVLCFLGPRESLLRIATLSRKFNVIVNDEYLWRHWCLQRIPSLTLGTYPLAKPTWKNCFARLRYGPPRSRLLLPVSYSVAVIGAQGSGKTALVNRYLHKTFSSEHEKSGDRSWGYSTFIADVEVTLKISEKALDASHRSSDCYLILLDLSSPDSLYQQFDNVSPILSVALAEKKMREAEPWVPAMLIGTKADLLDSDALFEARSQLAALAYNSDNSYLHTTTSMTKSAKDAEWVFDRMIRTIMARNHDLLYGPFQC